MKTLIHRTNSILSIQASLESATSVLSHDTSDDGQDTVRDTPTMTPTRKKSSIGLLPDIKGVSEQIRRVFGQYDVPACFKPMNTLRQILINIWQC